MKWKREWDTEPTRRGSETSKDSGRKSPRDNSASYGEVTSDVSNALIDLGRSMKQDIFAAS